MPRARTIRRLSVLTHREARVLRAVAETVFPADGTEMPSVDEAEVVEYVDDLLARAELKERVLIRGLLLLLEVQPIVFNGLSPKLFSRATIEERTRNLSGWEKSKIFERRLIFMAIRTLLLFAYADSQEAEKGMGLIGGTHAMARRNSAKKATQVVIDQAQGKLPVDHDATQNVSPQNHA